MLIFKRFVRWLRLLPFNNARAEFYTDLAQAIERKEGLVEYIQGEISNTAIDKNEARKFALKLILRRFPEARYAELLRGIVPSGDLMQLAALDEIKTTEGRAAALRHLSVAVKDQAEMFGMIFKALAIPVVMLPLGIIICYATAMFVVQIEKDAPPEVFRGFNGVVRLLSHYTYHYTPHIVGFLVAFSAAIAYWLPRYKGSLRLKADNIVGIGLYREYTSGVFAASLAAMLTNGKDLVAALQAVAANGSPWLQWQIGRILSTLQASPESYQRAFSRGLFSPAMTARMATLARTADSFSSVLVELGSTGIKKVKQQIFIVSLAMNGVLVGVILVVTTILSIGQLTVSSAYTNEMQPARALARMAAKAQAAEPGTR